jgi:hypothetical protein
MVNFSGSGDVLPLDPSDEHVSASPMSTRGGAGSPRGALGESRRRGVGRGRDESHGTGDVAESAGRRGRIRAGRGPSFYPFRTFVETTPVTPRSFLQISSWTFDPDEANVKNSRRRGSYAEVSRGRARGRRRWTLGENLLID